MQGTIWQSHLDYARIGWEKALKDSKKKFTYGDMLASKGVLLASFFRSHWSCFVLAIK